MDNLGLNGWSLRFLKLLFIEVDYILLFVLIIGILLFLLILHLSSTDLWLLLIDTVLLLDLLLVFSLLFIVLSILIQPYE